MPQSLLKAAAYYRKSTDKQEHSIERQRSQVIPYAHRQGYELVGDYADEGIAGDEFDKRPDFQRLLRDAAARKFSVIVVDEPSRLSRQDPIDFITLVVAPLRKAGVEVDTVASGPLNYESLAGLILSVIHADKSASETKHLSRRVITRLVQKAKQGRQAPSIIPYGYRAVRDDGGFRKLIPGDEDEVRVVRWIYDVVANLGWTLGQVVQELALRGVHPPKGNGCGRNKERGLWDKNTVRRLIRRRCYCGDLRWNGMTGSKKWEVKAGTVVPVAPGSKRWRTHDESDVILVTDAECLTPLVDRELWQRAQDALLRNRKMTSPKPVGESCYLFTHLLVCADCGGFMVGNHHRSGRRRYLCSTYQRQGRHACYANTVDEEKLLSLVLEALQREILCPERLEALREQMRLELKAQHRTGELKRLRRQIDQVGAKIDRGNENLALLPPDRIAGVVAKVRVWEGQRQGLLERVRQLENGEREIEQTIRAVEAHLWRFREGFQSGDPETTRAVLREIISQIELHFSHRQAKKLTVSKFTKGVLVPRPGLGVSQLKPSSR
jgi:DNA invertase Pin-like site-specific DNA recombinase